MNRKERTLRALQGLPVDRPPMAFWHHFVGEDMEKENFAASHVRFYRETGEDFIKMMCDGYVALPELEIRQPSDWLRIRLPKMSDPFVQEQITHIQRVREAIADETAIFYNIFNALSTMRSSTSDALVYAHLQDRSPELFAAVRAVNQFKMEFAQELIEHAGVTGFFLPMQNNDLHSFTGDCYQELIRPYDLELIAHANTLSPYNIVHLCGYWGVRNDLNNWKDFPGAAIHWDVHTDQLALAEGRDFFTHKRAVMGGFNNKEGSLIYTGSQAEVMAETAKIVKEAGPTGLILSSDCSLLETIDHRRVHWVADALDALIS